MEPLSIAIIWLLAIFTLSGPEDVVVLLPNPDGSKGAVAVTSKGGSQSLDTPYQAVTVSGASAAPSQPVTITETEVRRLFGTALDARPPLPKSYLLYFQTGTADLTEDSRALLPAVIKDASSRDFSDVSIIGHTDTVGGEDTNYRLALTRANATRQLLIDAGMAANQVDARSHGETDPLVPTNDGVDEIRNRRVEILIR